MPRRARITVAGVPHHVVQRGHNRQATFFADENEMGTEPNCLTNWIDPLGLRLCRIKLPTISGKDQEFLVDDTIAKDLRNLVRVSKALRIPVTFNNVYRTKEKQQELWDEKQNHPERNPNVVAFPGTSPHEGGFAFDVNVKKSSAAQDLLFVMLAKGYGFKAYSPRKKDPPHFQADPRGHGYRSFAEAIKKNRASYKNGDCGRECK